jgi:hypothetical protein
MDMTRSKSTLLRSLLLMPVLAAPILPVDAQGPAPELPAAPILAKVKTACLECHDSGIVVQQRLDRKMWGREVDKMTKWGALVEAADRDAFIDYFVANYGTDKPAAAPEYRAGPEAAKKAGKKDKKD